MLLLNITKIIWYGNSVGYQYTSMNTNIINEKWTTITVDSTTRHGIYRLEHHEGDLRCSGGISGSCANGRKQYSCLTFDGKSWKMKEWDCVYDKRAHIIFGIEIPPWNMYSNLRTFDPICTEHRCHDSCHVCTRHSSFKNTILSGFFCSRITSSMFFHLRLPIVNQFRILKPFPSILINILYCSRLPLWYFATFFVYPY